MATLYYERPDYNSLQHHGILGQKWGVRRFQNPDGTWTAAGKERYGEDSNPRKKSSEGSTNNKSLTDSTKERKHLTEGQKKAIKIGIAAVGVSLAAYGTYRLVKSGKLNPLINNGEKIVNKMLNGNAGNFTKVNASTLSTEKQLRVTDNAKKIAERTGLKIKDQAFSMADDIMIANKDYIPGAPQWKDNCGHASIANILRRMGLDVKAKPMGPFEEGGLTYNEVTTLFRRAKSNKVSFDKGIGGEAVEKKMSKAIIEACNGEDGSLGIVKLTRPNGGHFFTFEIDNGKVIFSNPQSNDIPPISHYFQEISDDKIVKELIFSRLDNLELRSNRILDFVENAK